MIIRYFYLDSDITILDIMYITYYYTEETISFKSFFFLNK